MQTKLKVPERLEPAILVQMKPATPDLISNTQAHTCTHPYTYARAHMHTSTHILMHIYFSHTAHAHSYYFTIFLFVSGILFKIDDAS